MTRTDGVAALVSVLIVAGYVAAATVTNGTAGAPPPTTPAPTAVSTTSSASTAAADLVGPGCAGYAVAVPTGAGSIVGMSQDPVAVAASNNPILKTLVKAVSGKLNPKVDLVSTLDGGQFTVFAPVDSAFAKLPRATIATLAKPAGAPLLTKILTYHVVAGQLLPSKIDGTLKTVEGSMVKVTGSGNNIKVNGASVICGGVHTANATVYLIDTVLAPPATK